MIESKRGKTERESHAQEGARAQVEIQTIELPRNWYSLYREYRISEEVEMSDLRLSQNE